MTALSWKSNFNETECRIFRGKVIAGILKTSPWKYDGRGELDGYMLTFKTTGFFQRHTEIRDIDGSRKLGEIEYNLLGSSARITYDGMHYKWKFDSWTRRKWQVSDGEWTARFEAAGFWKREGHVTNDDIPPPVVLASFFVQAYFRKISAAS
ncbi:hypothetical protein GCM10010967_49190 [Dyadobacter beijingensis]|uniref:Uncharacterized protein n=1 Tax=Dyadobacter beijingensis TaxID=365489 RepID=A0ABQ2IGJ3_9BACT|nr:hypothetical protein [Dyadobacter beijingensis]GGN07766.1 hypothetical protein GCM10010967_49190 [Dyadobacter beijingensis]